MQLITSYTILASFISVPVREFLKLEHDIQTRVIFTQKLSNPIISSLFLYNLLLRW